MPQLSKHWSDNLYLEEGWHNVKVDAFRLFTFNTGSDGVEFILKRGSAKAKIGFCLKDTILWKLAGFAKACGLSKEEAASYDTDQPNSHAVLLRRSVRVEIKNNADGYGDVVAWDVASDDDAADHGAKVQAAPARPKIRQVVPPVEEVDDDPIPF